MDEEVPAAAVIAAAASARALMRGPPGEEVVLEAMAQSAIALAERFCGRVLVARPDGDWTTVPGPVRQGVALLIQHLAEDRPGDLPPAAVAALWRPHRHARLL